LADGREVVFGRETLLGRETLGREACDIEGRLMFMLEREV
jgi:hypothetical protein